MSGVSRRRFAAAAAAISVSVVTLLFLLTVGFYGQRVDAEREIGLGSEQHGSGSGSNRKLLQVDEGTSSSSSSTDRVGDGCSKDDIVVHQGATPPLPSGIPTYTVVVLNLCPSRGGCAMAHIHLTCGAFSSARLVNPRIFRRLRVNDCLLNDGRPLPSGSSISFQYANSFSYPLAVSNASCIRSS
ncbi:TPD1 protein homolog 1-like [Musa acuminata AAA Group]|uniref:TPD1 protein homolog 1-like n=1 Tax=Musa acuminata AAA Group TaxID=214697 RepID=UPI0031D0B59C